MCGELQGEMSCFEHELGPSQFLILATDGLTDNLRDDGGGGVVPVLMRARCFDTVPSSSRECAAELPTVEEIVQFAERSAVAAAGSPAASAATGSGQAFDAAGAVTPLAAASRLTNYLQWVTASKRTEEQVFYQVSGR
eukprot:g1765.t1